MVAVLLQGQVLNLVLMALGVEVSVGSSPEVSGR